MIVGSFVERIHYVLAGSVLTLVALYFSGFEGVEDTLFWIIGAFVAVTFLHYVRSQSTRNANDLKGIKGSSNG